MLTTFSVIISADLNEDQTDSSRNFTISVHKDIIQKKDRLMKSKERSFHIETAGTTCPMNNMPGTGWACIFHLIRPWPDQMYYSFFGFINYENGTTTIEDTSTGETMHREGAHKVLFYNFYGPVSSFKSHTVSLEGNVIFATVIGGE